MMSRPGVKVNLLDYIQETQLRIISAFQKCEGNEYEVASSLVVLSGVISKNITLSSATRLLIQSFRELSPLTTSSFSTSEEDDFL